MRAVVLKHLEGEGPGLLGDILSRHGIEFDCVNLNAGLSMPAPENCQLMLVMGASQQVWQEDKYPWLVEEKATIRHWVQDLRKPYFGVCFGHQLLADALGGEVGPAKKDELGMLQVKRSEAASADPVFSAMADNDRWLQWHTAEVIVPPPDARVTASSKACAIQAMSVGPHAASIQFHAEATMERVDSWLTVRECIDNMAALRGEGAHERFLKQALEYLPQANKNAERLFTRWLSVNGLIRAERAPAAAS
ncbi:MAG: type 1 glutamine amidotransferase [Hyphomicrobiales bacterium]